MGQLTDNKAIIEQGDRNPLEEAETRASCKNSGTFHKTLYI
jgi:hypothetical protein